MNDESEKKIHFNVSLLSALMNNSNSWFYFPSPFSEFPKEIKPFTGVVHPLGVGLTLYAFVLQIDARRYVVTQTEMFARRRMHMDSSKIVWVGLGKTNIGPVGIQPLKLIEFYE